MPAGGFWKYYKAFSTEAANKAETAEALEDTLNTRLLAEFGLVGKIHE